MFEVLVRAPSTPLPAGFLMLAWQRVTPQCMPLGKATNRGAVLGERRLWNTSQDDTGCLKGDRAHLQCIPPDAAANSSALPGAQAVEHLPGQHGLPEGRPGAPARA